MYFSKLLFKLSRFTYEIAPVFILMEHFVLEKMRHIIGFMDGDSILAPGGAISNLYSVIVARHKMFPEYKHKGMRALPKQLVMFTSEHVSNQPIEHSRLALRTNQSLTCKRTNLNSQSESLFEQGRRFNLRLRHRQCG